ncbi:tRNA (adenosine(37)-N6)-dimethylallyltransferase MiaA [Sandaracinobacter sp. RS1-74]|nr:tRNA (adenosine(37)-N6)-dimethylallyltransferase MiaA [Sandaracinobacteroides sayramensis]MCG2839398.1 tRNA (adenosine(37)-N6)-dimethylallyltransferase MiaA [Sandaracinobacteroides sayramensis]
MGSGKPPLAVIAGPTASGKSAMALEMAEAEKGVIINADASQLYAELSILSARPSAAEMARAPHRLFGVVDGAESCTAARWAELARAEIAAAHEAGRLPILVGGTGLYLRTLLEGIAPVPEIPDEVRADVRRLSTGEVRAALEREDPAMAARLHPHDTQRNARALEVVRASGRSLASWQQAEADGGLGAEVALRPLVIDIPRPALVERIDARVGAMWREGALEEVRHLAARGLSRTLPVMRAIGVPPLLALLAGTLSEEAALARWRLDTRQYAKRQATWLRNQMGGWPRIPARLG